MKKSISDRLFLFLGVFFTAVSLIALAALMQFKSKADSTNQRVQASNGIPTVDSVTISDSSYGSIYDPIVLQEATTKTVYVHGQISDPNGCTDLASIDVVLYRIGVGGGCLPDNNNCYTASSSTFANCTGAGDNSADYQVSFNLKNYADPTDTGAPYDADSWWAYVEATDGGTAHGDAYSSHYEVQSLAAFNLYAAGVQNGTIDYGTVALGATSAEKTLTFDNTGNRAVSSTIYANADMTSNLSGYDDIPTTAAHYASTTFTYGTGDTAVELFASFTAFDIYLPKQTSDASSTVPGYFQLRMPASGVNGTYTNTLTLTAVS